MQLIAAMLAGAAGCSRATPDNRGQTPMTDPDPSQRAHQRTPVLFVGHGSPLHTLTKNQWTDGFAALAEQVPRPAAILAISAHWYVNGTYLTANASPETIHDFSGFPRPLYEIQYPAPGSADVAERARQLLGERAGLNAEWGLDHGTWTVLRWMYPDADIPTIQLSIDRRLAPKQHFELARSLAELRDQGVLIIGSGNVTHNLRDAMGRMRASAPETPAWARAFDDQVKTAVVQRDTAKLTSTWPDDDIARRSHPTPDHWLPLLYAYAATDDRDQVTFPTTGFDLGSLSMRNILFS
ncbi:MAG: 4,5-DOPA dioxygenase extradiol [Haliangiales bacterium]